MILLFTLKEKVFLSEKFEEESDPLKGDEGIEIAIIQRYVCLFGIPYHGTRKIAKAYSIGTDQMIPVLLWSASIKRKADNLISHTTGAWKNRILGQILLLLLIAFFAWIFIKVLLN